MKKLKILFLSAASFCTMAASAQSMDGNLQYKPVNYLVKKGTEMWTQYLPQATKTPIAPAANVSPMTTLDSVSMFSLTLQYISFGSITDPAQKSVKVFGAVQVIPKNVYVPKQTNQFLYNKAATQADELWKSKNDGLTQVKPNSTILMYAKKKEANNVTYDILITLYNYNSASATSKPFAADPIRKSFQNIDLGNPTTMAAMQKPFTVTTTTASGESVTVTMKLTVVK